jgi:hypothetical protein
MARIDREVEDAIDPLVVQRERTPTGYFQTRNSHAG